MAGAEMATLISQVRRLGEQLRRAGQSQSILINTLLDDQLELRTALPVRLEFDGSQYIASSVDLNVHGSGETESETLDDFRPAVAQFYFSLKGEKLGTDLRRRFAYLRSVIREK